MRACILLILSIFLRDLCAIESAFSHLCRGHKDKKITVQCTGTSMEQVNLLMNEVLYNRYQHP